MKKILKTSSFVFLLSVLLCSIALFSPKADAASYPYISPEEFDMTATAGKVVEIKYTYMPAFNNEEIYIEIFSPDGYKVAESSRTFNNAYSSSIINYTVTWDTSDYEPGQYKVVVTKRFYSMYEWHEAPTTTVHYITLVEAGQCPHKYETTTTKATTSKNGKTVNKCTVCGNVKSSSTIYKISSIKLSQTSFVYDGKAKTPSVVVKDSKGNTIAKKDNYTVKYASDRTNSGKYAVKITFSGSKYSGSKTLYFSILPSKPKTIKATQTTDAITLKWSAVPGATGYRIFAYSKSTKEYTKIATVKNNQYTVKNRKAGTTYGYLIRAYSKVNDKTYWSSYSAKDVFYTATKPVTPKISKIVSSSKGTATLAWADIKGETGYQVYYSTQKDSGYKKYSNYAANTKKATVKKLSSKKTYYFKIKAYTTTSSGTVYSSFSAVKSIKIK